MSGAETIRPFPRAATASSTVAAGLVAGAVALRLGVLVLGLMGLLLFLAGWLGEKKETPEKLRPYECGVIPTGWARFRYPVPFYLVAVFFLIFDVEAAFIFAWYDCFVR